MCVPIGPAASAAPSKGVDISSSTILERYTLIDGDSFKYETGFLLSSGQFLVVTSEIDYYSFYGLTPDDLSLISDKPVMNETLYDAYHNLEIIPNWAASTVDVTIGFVSYVVVAVKGKATCIPPSRSPHSPKATGRSWETPVFFYVDAEPWDYLTYHWYLNNKPIPGVTSDSLWVDNVTSSQGGVYKCAVSSGGPAVMSQGALLTIVTPISIKKQPTPLTTKTGKKATFKVLVAGTPPFHYEWHFRTNNIPGATNASYSIGKVQTSDAGFYWVAADNVHAYIGSSPAQLTVTP